MNYYIIALKRLLPLLLLLTVFGRLQAQQLKTVEYFYDTDPGLGKGTPVVVPKGKAIDSAITFSVAALSNGLHTVFVRSQDTAGKWSLSYTASFIKTTGGTAGGSSIAYVNKVEYFFDKDPGVGNGTQLTVAANKTTIDSAFAFNVSSLSNGLHTVYVRAQDNSDNWNLAYSASFIKTTGGTPGGSVAYVNKVEYYFDKDPGVGNGTQVPVAANKTSIDSTFTFNVGSLTNGLHTLYVRAQDGNENWNISYNTSFIKQIGNDSVLNITKLEYYLDVDPGFGKGTALPIMAAANISDSFNFVVPDNGANTRNLYVRALDTRGNWSLVYNDTINLCQLYKTTANFGWVRFGSRYSFIDSSQNNPTHKLFWEFGGLAVDSVSNPQFAFPQGNYYVTLTAGTRGSCRSDSVTLPIFVGLENYYPNNAMAGGDIVLALYGGGLDTNAVVTLQNGGATIAPYAKVAYDLQAFGGVYDLHTAQPGLYNINVQFSNGYDTTIVNGFQILPLTDSNYSPEIDLSVVGIHYGRPGAVLHHKLIVTNSGSMLAKSVPIWTAAPAATVAGSLPPFQLDPAYSNFVAPDNNIDYQDSIPTTVAIDTAFGQPFTGTLNNFMIPALNAGQSFSYSYNIVLPQAAHGTTVEVDFWPSQRMFGSPYEWDCMHQRLSNALNIIGVVPVAGCVASFISFGIDFTSGILGSGGLNNDHSYDPHVAVGNFLYGAVGAIAGCIPGEKLYQAAKASETAAKAINATVGLTSAAGNLYQNNVDNPNSSPCAQDQPWGTRGRQLLRDINSVDPNGISGPAGYGDANYVNGKGKQGYEIDFENKPTATANAQRVYLLDTLDKTKFDLSTFEMTSLGVGDSIITVPNQRKEFTVTKDLRPTQNVLLRVNAKLDTATGILSCTYLSIDPVTMDTLTASDIRGFLPPDVDNVSGIGYLDYVVKFKPTLVTNDVISNSASIIFDNNAPIPTNIWTNTIDKTGATGKITGSSKINDTTILLNISASDVGVGVDHSAIYIAEGKQAFVSAGVITGDTLRFTGQLDSTYSFYAIPYDSVNNYVPKGSPDYSLTFTPNALPLLLTNFSGQYVKGVNVLTATITDAINVKTVELQRSADGVHFSYLGTMATGPTIGGTYSYYDNTPFGGDNYYRLRVIDNDGGLSFSKIVLLDNSNQTQVSIYPNPFVNNMALQFTNAKAGNYFVAVSDMAGRKLATMQITLNQGNQTITLPASSYARGTYFAVITDALGNILLNQKVAKLK